jgi:hypothetical protein
MSAERPVYFMLKHACYCYQNKAKTRVLRESFGTGYILGSRSVIRESRKSLIGRDAKYEQARALSGNGVFLLRTGCG